MNPLPLIVGLALLSGDAGAKAKAEEPSPELLANLDFFMKYELIKNLDLLGAEPLTGIRVSTSTAAIAASTTTVASAPAAKSGGKP